MKKIFRNTKRLVSQTAAISLMTAAMIGSNSSPVSAASIFKEFTFDVQGVNNPALRVTSSDEKKWDTIKPGSGVFWAHLRADVKYPNYVGAAAVFLGQCGQISCVHEVNPSGLGNLWVTGKSELLFLQERLKTRDFNTSQNIPFGYQQLGDSRIASGSDKTYKEHILERCNAGLTENGPTKEVKFQQEIYTSFGITSWVKHGNVGKAKDLTAGAINHAKTSSFWIDVICEPKKIVPMVVGEIAPQKVNYLKVFLSTYSHTFSQPKAGVQCKKGRALMRVKTNRIGPVKLKLTTQLGSGPLKSDTFEVFAKLNSEGVPQAEVKKWFSTTESTILKARLSTVSPEGSHTNWEELPLNCSSSGGGGWAQPDAPDDGVPDPVADNTGNEGTPAASAPVKGELSLMDSSKTGSGLARKGTAFMLITSTEPAAQAYRLKCNNGFDRKGQTKPKKVAVGQYAYARQHVFSVAKTEFVKCVLRWTSPTKSIVLDTAERTYQVLNPGSRPAGKPTVGNMAQQKGPNVGDDPFNFPLKLKTEVKLRDDTPQAAQYKKRTGRVVVTATSNYGNKVKYKLRCGKGRQWSGEITPKKIGINQYQFTKNHYFPVKKTQTVKCILRVKTGKGMPGRATTQRKYQVDAAAKADAAGQTQ